MIPKVKPGETRIIEIPDSIGNLLTATHKGEKLILLTLKLLDDKKIRHIGTILKQSRILHVRRERAAHLHRKSNSYGFMYMLVKESNLFDNVRLQDEYGSYLIPKPVIQKQGKVMCFKNSADGESYELQYFLPLDTILKYQEESPI